MKDYWNRKIEGREDVKKEKSTAKWLMIGDELKLLEVSVHSANGLRLLESNPQAKEENLQRAVFLEKISLRCPRLFNSARV